jgi:hypothetical protein
MEIGKLLKNKEIVTRKKGEPMNYRQDLLQQILDKVNPGRIRDGYKPLTIPAMEARYTGGISFNTLSWHVAECNKAENFGKKFFGCLKLKKQP